MRKIITLAGAAALLLGAAAPAMAHFRFTIPSYDTHNDATVSTAVSAVASTGDNSQTIGGAGTNLMGTGSAFADASAATFVNLFDPCGCLKGDLYNNANVGTVVTADANTGGNTQVVDGSKPDYRISLRHHELKQPKASNTLWTGIAQATGSTFTVVNAAWMPTY